MLRHYLLYKQLVLVNGYLPVAVILSSCLFCFNIKEADMSHK